jgi:ribosomal protein L7/L12
MSVSARFARLERRVDLLLKNTGVDLAKIAAEEAATLARAGNKIEAIKVYRDYTGVSLAEAKAKVEALASSAG